ncbi:MAG: hypothetical protein Q4A54_02430 [Parabacteroides sp.]|nr:hypothetical protein [Parabacteroides sp.]
MTGWLKMKLMALVTFVNAVVGIVYGALLHTLWPELYFKWYPIIPIFYWLTAMIMAYFLDKVKRENGEIAVSTFMLIRLSRFSLAIILLWIYVAIIKDDMMMFGITIMLFYFIYLILETYIIYLFDKKRMKREKRERDEMLNQ